ncbi:hypothetical protein EMIHUDRAFT_425546 [Emiliania huxleyi CCMP1516]|uniref:Phospholipid scramblase n=2 Tax=Emiliania huxleyi TaxID=2903 RepID=A0A0D3KWT4_EMIH1|nr:hypothetical protein EMIHUDRAFT_425178 [Emiliania huxleyi CCMP1516]XP_005787758.1 hypothetical protein EMIHUDRAFT_420902 [Emiliania huxleyi CCMP1516]XP_005792648.1 hypothetical protein EMIHUDRAFT_425546 [Emiliania huxleyi CCMP1516]EOD13407.1 hypothetical protein EMIHUDRAFT_425178 [Emiliania huxleyi CCMP1516]EOD35329.1 hypothetical protein EMIHUDRAFT_420902 [Emiliania huxleyi CCMP1516]EOD40219.1 hypothetical protein EMIHUDRAFT_425546 [Emiliania huxleyi CCMP1516]|eukprot:XP_005765836.1 hypothetical protein EMIHUDRAFT_425178 [Emiliania huxleyi CCMP1516]
MLTDTRAHVPPSACGKALCFCDDAYPRMLAGVMIEGEGGITGTVLTKRWMEFDAETKSGLIKTYGGYGGLYSAAQWSGGNNFFENGVGPFFNRCCNQSYGFQFTEDYLKATISVKLNFCICIPCLPPFFKVPECCIACDMVQEPEGHGPDGSNWNRRQAICPLCCGGEMKHLYYLQNVVTPDGRRGVYYDQLSKIGHAEYYFAR